MTKSKTDAEPFSLRIPDDVRVELEALHARSLGPAKVRYGIELSFSDTVRRVLRAGLEQIKRAGDGGLAG